MFPIERKNEFLRYVMITESYDEWSDVVFEYIENNNIKNWKEGFNFVVEYSDDPSWHAFRMARDGYTEPEWAMKVIKNATTGNPSEAAYNMVRYKLAKPEWARKVIENATIGDPLWAAYWMAKDGYATQEWYEEIKRKFNASN